MPLRLDIDRPLTQCKPSVNCSYFKWCFISGLPDIPWGSHLGHVLLIVLADAHDLWSHPRPDRPSQVEFVIIARESAIDKPFGFQNFPKISVRPRDVTHPARCATSRGCTKS